jgi:uncharacterized protein
MISPFRKANAVIGQLDEFFSVIDEGTYLFDEGIKDLFSGSTEHFQKKLIQIRMSEKTADALLKDIETALYKFSLLPELRSDVMRLMQRIDDIMDTMKEVLVQFDVEQPHIPAVLHAPLIQLTGLCALAAREANNGAKIFFRNSPESIPHIDAAKEYEHKADDLAEKIKRRAFHELDELTLPEKFHIRYFTLHIESVSDIAKSVAYTVDLMLVKRFK